MYVASYTNKKEIDYISDVCTKSTPSVTAFENG
jgi:hypothetical protein